MGKQGGPGIAVGQLDRKLVPRIENYALNRDLNDVDAVVDHLRRSYKEYQRRQVGALRQMVARAVQVVQRKGPSKPELALEVRRAVRRAPPPATAPRRRPPPPAAPRRAAPRVHRTVATALVPCGARPPQRHAGQQRVADAGAAPPAPAPRSHRCRTSRRRPSPRPRPPPSRRARPRRRRGSAAAAATSATAAATAAAAATRTTRTRTRRPPRGAPRVRTPA
jgi:hypothetical protein